MSRRNKFLLIFQHPLVFIRLLSMWPMSSSVKARQIGTRVVQTSIRKYTSLLYCTLSCRIFHSILKLNLGLYVHSYHPVPCRRIAPFTLINCKSYRDTNSKSQFLFAQLNVRSQFLWSHDHCNKPELAFLSNKKVDYHVDTIWCQTFKSSRFILSNRYKPWRWAY